MATNLQQSEKNSQLAALKDAIHASDLPSVTSLLALDASLISTPDADGRLPIHHAVVYRSWPVFAYLAKADASHLAIPDASGWTTLHMAASVGADAILSAIIAHLHPPDGTADESLNPRQFIDAQNSTGRTALHYAASKGHLNCTRLLLEYGASPRVLDQLGQAPLHRAATLGHAEIAKALLERDGSVAGWADGDKKTPEMLAREEGHAEVLQLFSRHTAA